MKNLKRMVSVVIIAIFLVSNFYLAVSIAAASPLNSGYNLTNMTPSSGTTTYANNSPTTNPSSQGTSTGGKKPAKEIKTSETTTTNKKIENPLVTYLFAVIILTLIDLTDEKRGIVITPKQEEFAIKILAILLAYLVPWLPNKIPYVPGWFVPGWLIFRWNLVEYNLKIWKIIILEKL